MVYIVSDRSLPLVHADERYPGFSVSEADTEVATRIRSCVPAPYIYYATSWQGCGCGFCYEGIDEIEAALAQIPADLVEENRRMNYEWRLSGYGSVTSLGRYLMDNRAGGSLFVYVAWAGEEGQPISERATVTPAFFSGDSFGVPDPDTLLTIAGE